jgi:hypothetical protein
MAKYVPKGVIQTPDLVGRAYEMDMQRFGLARQLAEEEQKKQAAASAMIAKEKKTYLRNPELRRIAQEAWDGRTAAGYKYTMNPNPLTKSAYDEANSLYLESAAQAKVLDDQEWETMGRFLASKPTDYPFTREEVTDMYSTYNRNFTGVDPQTFIAAPLSPFILRKTDDIPLIVPDKLADSIVDDVKDLFDTNPSYRNENGSLNYAKAIDYVNTRVQKEVENNPDKTGVWGALNEKMIPTNDIQRYAGFGEGEKADFQQKFSEAVVSLAEPRISGMAGIEKVEKKGSGYPSLYAALRPDRRNIGIVGPVEDPVGELFNFSGSIYKLPQQAFIKGDEYTITEFGKNDAGELVVRKQQQKSVPTAFGTSVIEYEDLGWYRANTEDINLMKNRMKGFYDDYIGSESVSSQEVKQPKKKAVLD